MVVATNGRSPVSPGRGGPEGLHQPRRGTERTEAVSDAWGEQEPQRLMQRRVCGRQSTTPPPGGKETQWPEGLRKPDEQDPELQGSAEGD